MSTANATLADLAIKRPGATRVFLKHGLDFCCGGRHPLEEALAEKGLDRDAILAEIEREDAKGGDLARWADWPLAELLDFIEGHYHARHRVNLPEVIAMAEKVEQVIAAVFEFSLAADTIDKLKLYDNPDFVGKHGKRARRRPTRPIRFSGSG